jgi:hypothetical protein
MVLDRGTRPEARIALRTGTQRLEGPSHADPHAPPRLRIARCNGAQRLGVMRLQPRKTRGNDVRVVALRAAQAVAHRLRAAPVAVEHTVADRASSFAQGHALLTLWPPGLFGDCYIVVTTLLRRLRFARFPVPPMGLSFPLSVGPTVVGGLPCGAPPLARSDKSRRPWPATNRTRRCAAWCDR